SVLLGNGDGTFAAPQTYALPGSANSIALGDFNQDGTLDIATTGPEIDVLLNNGNGTFGAAQNEGPAGSSVLVADFNGDGFPDLAQSDAAGGTIDVLLNNADWSKHKGPNASVVAAAGNGDSLPSLAQIDASATIVNVLLNNGDWTNGHKEH